MVRTLASMALGPLSINVLWTWAREAGATGLAPVTGAKRGRKPKQPEQLPLLPPSAPAEVDEALAAEYDAGALRA